MYNLLIAPTCCTSRINKLGCWWILTCKIDIIMNFYPYFFVYRFIHSPLYVLDSYCKLKGASLFQKYSDLLVLEQTFEIADYIVIHEVVGSTSNVHWMLVLTPLLQAVNPTDPTNDDFASTIIVSIVDMRSSCLDDSSRQEMVEIDRLNILSDITYML